MLNRTKLLAAAVLLAGGLTAGVGAGVYSNADAQPPPSPTTPRATTPPPAIPPSADPPPLTPPTPALPPLPAPAGMAVMAGGPGRVRWEYNFVRGGYPAPEFIQLFTDLGNDGWEFCGYWDISDTNLPAALAAHPDKLVNRGGTSVTMMFKRQTAAAQPVRVSAIPLVPRTPQGGIVASPGVRVSGTGQTATADALYKAADKNGDGRLTGDEMPPHLGQTYKAYDTNRDDAIDRAEFGAYLNEVLAPKEAGPPVSPFGRGGPGAAETGGAAKPAPAVGFQVIELKHSRAGEVAKTLRDLFGNDPLGVAADERTNAVIFHPSSKDVADRVRLLVNRLDAPAGTPPVRR